MERPGFIVPPPGLVPEHSGEDSETVRVRQRHPELPTFVSAPPGAPPPSVPNVDALETEGDPIRAVPAPVVETAAEQTPAPVAEATQDTDRSVVRNTSAGPQWSLALHDGSVIRVSGMLLLGRDPAPTPGWNQAGLLRVNDPERSVSKTHAGLDCTDGRFIITDLHSTNGIAVIGQDGTETVLEPGAAAEVETGATVELGRYRIRVYR